MEPMNLGTPSNSGPSSPATAPSSPYLPSFLLGEPSFPPSGSTSPQGKRASDQQSPKFLLNQSSTFQLSQNQDQYTPDKSSGPPIRGLFDTVTSPVINKKPNEAYISNVAQHFRERGNETGDTTWVTVFGFPPAAAGFILSQMASCGNIVTKKVPANGNWMHLQFSSKLEAKRALACNGKIFGNSVMIGVVPCRDSAIVEKTQEKSLCETSSLASPYSPRSPLSPRQDTSSSFVDNSVYGSPFASPRTVRHLATRQENEINGRGNIPQRNSGIFSKAMEYIGW